MRQRGERIERSFAHLYDTGMRRTHLRGHDILKRLLIHAGGFNRVMRPDRDRHAARVQGRVAAVVRR